MNVVIHHPTYQRKKRGLPTEPMEFPDSNQLNTLSEDQNLRFPHESDGIRYDLQSPYNHFTDPI